MHPTRESLDLSFFSDAFRDSPAPSVIVSAEGNILFWNSAAEELFGWTEEEVIGQPLPFVPPDRIQEHKLMRRRDLEGVGFTNRQIQRLHKDGTLLELGVSTAPVRGADGRVAGIISVYTDISAEKRVEETLRLRQALADEQLEQLERFYATAPIGLGFLDTDLRYVRVNERLAQINGLPLGAHFARRIEDVTPEFSAGIMDACRRVIGTGEAVTEFELKAATPACPGEPKEWLVSLHPLKQPNGEVLGVTMVISDITERNQFTDKLSRHEKLLRLVIDGMPGLVCYLDCDYRYQFNNRCYGDWYQRPISDFTGRRLTETIGLETFERIRPFLERAFHGEHVTFEHQATFAGRVRDVRATYSPDRGPDGKVRGVVAVVQDISEHKRSELALRNSEERFRRIVEIAAEGIWILDTHGRTTFVNGRMADLLGCSPADMIGRSFIEYLDPEDVARGRNSFEDRKMGDRRPHEYRFRKRDGSQIWLDITAAPMRGNDGVLTGVLGMCTDVTERKEAESQLRQTQKLESLGILAGGIAHDFNNLLVGIMGNAGLAADSMQRNTPVRAMLESVVSASERAAQLTRQLLAYAGKGQGAQISVDLSRLVRELTPLLGSSISKMVTLSLDLDHVPAVEGDAAQLQQVVMNLIINAAESIPASTTGMVKVKVQARRLTAADRRHAVIPIESPAERYVVLTVNDTGSGMDESTQARIFDPFFTTKFEGRGLGLSAVIGIVRGHGGTLTLSSAPGKGAAFSVLLPASAATVETSPAASAHSDNAPGTGAILVVDDEASVRLLAQRVLERQGYQVLAAENGREALEMVEAHPEIRAVLLDLTMPVMSGDAAAELLREKYKSLPLILSSGYSESEALDRFGKDPLMGFLQKPYTFDGLIDKVQAALKAAST